MTSTDNLLDTTDRALIGRAHHVVDIENLLGLTRAMSIDPATGRLYRGLVQAGDHDLFTVAADVNRWPDAKFAFGGAHVVAGYGPDGADRALDAAVDLDHIAARFDTLVIASGDHWFTDMAYRAGRLGLHVVVDRERWRSGGAAGRATTGHGSASLAGAARDEKGPMLVPTS